MKSYLIFTILVIIIMSTTLLSAANISSFQCISDNTTSTELIFTTPEFILKNVESNNENYTKIELINFAGSDFSEIGKPDVPSFSKLVVIPERCSVEIEVSILESEIYKDVYLIPSRNLNNVDKGISDYVVKQEFYNSEEIFPSNIVTISSPGIMRDNVIATLTINPFQYIPAKKELHIAKSINIKLNYIQDRNGLSLKHSFGQSPIFHTLTENLVINKARIQNRTDFQIGSYLFIYSGNSTILQTLQCLIDWKHRKGYEVHILNTSEIGNQANQIKEYIQNAYDTWDNPPEFILIVGDANGSFMIPTFFESYGGQNVHGDHPYTLLEGNDIFPDALIGRLSFDSIFELQTQIAKILNYEQEPFISGDDWLNRALLVGDPYGSGISTITTMLYISEIIQENELTVETNLVYELPFIPQIRNALNEGVGAYFYRGFYGISGWEIENTNELTNVYKTPFISCITCYTGNFANYGVISAIESFIRAGTPTSPTGAVAAIGSSSATHTCLNNIITAGIAYGIYEEGLTSLAAALNRGKLALYENYPSNPNNYVDWYTIGKNLLGDPGMMLWTKRPEEMTIIYSDEIPIGSNFLSVSITDSTSNPIPDVWVTLLKGDDEIFTSDFTDENGIANVEFNYDSTGVVLLTATKQNYLSYLGEFEIVSDSESVNFYAVTNLTDFVTGDTASFNIQLKNYGSTTAENVTATISTENDYITILDSISLFDPIFPNEVVTSLSAYSVEISDNCLDGEEIEFFISIQCENNQWEGLFCIGVSGPFLEITDILLYDLSDTFDLELTIHNSGSILFSDANAILNCNSALVTVEDSTAFFGDVLPGENVTNSDDLFKLSVDEDYIIGSEIQFNAIFYNDNVHQIIPFIVNFGEASVTDPTGPDTYGYYCYDDGDVGYAEVPVYNWIEIDPDYGGNGTQLDMWDLDYEGFGDIEVVNLPFTFRFYGNVYNQISISSNGFIMPGSKFSIEWMNWSIPGPLVPKPIIAPFWDDLIITEGHVCYHYEEAMHALIVEWSRLLNRYDNSIETFQAILYDVNYEYTNLGDSKIKFQYYEVHNVDQGNYGGFEIDHGEYATVGIGDHTSQVGLEYSYSNEYPETAKPLEDNMALQFTGPPVPISEPYLIVTELNIIEQVGNQDSIPNNGETLDLIITLRNLGFQTANNITVSLSCSNQYITILQDYSTCGDLEFNETGECNQAFSIEIAENCPNNTDIDLIFMMEYSGISNENIAPIRIFSPDLGFSSYIYTDDNDNQLEAGETGTFTIILQKLSYLPIEYAIVEVQPDDDEIAISPESQEIINLTEDEISLTYQVAASDSASNGELIIFQISITLNENTKEYSFDYVIGHPELIFYEDFSEGWQNHWLQIDGYIGTDNYAGGTGNEFILTSHTYFQQLLVTNPIYAYDIQKIIVNFKYRNLNGESWYGFGRVVDDFWFGLWGDAVSMDEPDSVHIEDIPNPSLEEEVLFIWLLAPNETSSQMLALDDIEIYAIRHNPGFIEGTITLDGGSANVMDVTLTNDIESIHPDENGYYSFTCPIGFYDVNAYLFGYSEEIVTDIEVVPNEIVTIDFTLEYLDAPENLAFFLEGDTITLFWDFNGFQNPNFEQFNVFLKYTTHFINVGSTTENEFTMLLNPNFNYLFYVNAEYTNGISDSSNIVEVIFVSTDEQESEPIQTALISTYPNPFRTESKITYSLKEDCIVTINIYNLRGQLIRILVNKKKGKGFYSVVWNGKDKNNKIVSSGIYFYRLFTQTLSATEDVSNYNKIKKMVLLR
ncbi:MAG: T9SS type A sorting domain-containing protein [Candidatus Cloacimonetes bacterium]|nr:T9SS type A sorting domain-containing protein [Candidatus Cloacimonadota bacterium]MBL7086103.1 T9SS type A sorting domain-containing protein [Candidatus Cloacimonadota bacterium]